MAYENAKSTPSGSGGDDEMALKTETKSQAKTTTRTGTKTRKKTETTLGTKTEAAASVWS